MEKQRRTISLDTETDEYIQSYMEEHHFRFPGEAIMDICQKYRNEQSKEWSLKYISEVVSQNLHGVLKEELKKIRLGTNATDKNTQILIEYMNGLFAFQGFKGLITTQMREMDSTRIARELVEERIAHQRQKRIDWEESRGKSTSTQ
ncbi:hypothetical protein [Priestia megaterium]|uniref:hypothetical protein n=1 Tax=Priestia megaterium TaxID=1404 RepID=UPI001A952640|nr:hypothetical protein [Priestia megaterium]QSX24205.1 hypothetical protein J0P05_31270 [Priestia megaterium]